VADVAIATGMLIYLVLVSLLVITLQILSMRVRGGLMSGKWTAPAASQ
jgi:hypothetical protein